MKNGVLEKRTDVKIQLGFSKYEKLIDDWMKHIAVYDK